MKERGKETDHNLAGLWKEEKRCHTDIMGGYCGLI